MRNEIIIDKGTLEKAVRRLRSRGWLVQTSVDLLISGIVMAVEKNGYAFLLDWGEVLNVARFGELYLLEAPHARGVTYSPLSEGTPGYWARRYAERALAAIEARFNTEAKPGNRNNALNRAAYALGRLVGGQLISREEAELTLRAWAEAVFLPSERREVESTIQSGLRAGERRPVQLKGREK